mmetsp:Transcript_33885/g.84875  ORF Transcript_33885/g.84875 Transcript_33885/m.84875 type:complete len:271 (+) Transcript_33885:261-1073(+)
MGMFHVESAASISVRESVFELSVSMYLNALIMFLNLFSIARFVALRRSYVLPWMPCRTLRMRGASPNRLEAITPKRPTPACTSSAELIALVVQPVAVTFLDSSTMSLPWTALFIACTKSVYAMSPSLSATHRPKRSSSSASLMRTFHMSSALRISVRERRPSPLVSMNLNAAFMSPMKRAWMVFSASAILFLRSCRLVALGFPGGLGVKPPPSAGRAPLCAPFFIREATASQNSSYSTVPSPFRSHDAIISSSSHGSMGTFHICSPRSIS